MRFSTLFLARMAGGRPRPVVAACNGVEVPKVLPQIRRRLELVVNRHAVNEDTQHVRAHADVLAPRGPCRMARKAEAELVIRRLGNQRRE